MKEPIYVNLDVKGIQWKLPDPKYIVNKDAIERSCYQQLVSSLPEDTLRALFDYETYEIDGQKYADARIKEDVWNLIKNREE